MVLHTLCTTFAHLPLFCSYLMPRQELKHESVLPKETLEQLLHGGAESVFDGTLGLGGHAQLVLAAYPNVKKYLGTDLDAQHLATAQQNLSDFGTRFVGVESNFSQLGELITQHNLPRPLCILLDLGVCSNHFDDEVKGFSFRTDGPLHMAFSNDETQNCEALINEESTQGLTNIMRHYGEEPSAWRIAQRINEAREHKAIKTTGELKEIVEKAVAPKDRKKALARVFQAFRIATNDELGHLEKALSSALDVMETGDRIGVMSFHSLEDRIVKKFFRTHSRPVTQANNFSLHAEVAPASLKLLTKKAIEASPEEVAQNPRSRSVKFRIAEKL